MIFFTSVSSIIDTYTHIIFWTLLSCLARIGLTNLTNYNNSYIHTNSGLNGSCIWSNFAACLILSFLTHSTNPWGFILDDYYKVAGIEKDETSHLTKKHLSIYVGLSTGFCGGLSTFSSLLLELFVKTADFLNSNGESLPNHGYGVMEFFSVILVQGGICFLGVKLGKDLNTLVSDYIPKYKDTFSFKTIHFITQILSIVGVCLLIAMIILSCILHNDNIWKIYSLSLCFAPFGGWLRLWLGKFSLNRNFPLGTLIANIIACTLIGILSILIHGQHKSGQSRLISNDLQILILKGFQSGFCGCLSTISTFIMEIYTLDGQGKTLLSYSYFTVSVLSCFAIILILFGSYGWAVGVTI